MTIACKTIVLFVSTHWLGMEDFTISIGNSAYHMNIGVVEVLNIIVDLSAVTTGLGRLR